MAKIELKTKDRCEVVDLTGEVAALCRKWGGSGLVHIFCNHTTAGLAINENADSSVKRDILAALEKLVPANAGYTHAEGNSDAHIKSVLTGVQLSVPVEGGRMLLGTWQGIYFMEFDGPRQRGVTVTFVEGAE